MKANHHDADALVIIPTYNEKENIALLIRAILSLLGNFHILVVDDSSPDGTSRIVAELQTVHQDRLYLINRKEKCGLGTAYLDGFKFALKQNYQYILTIDADFSHVPDDLVGLYSICKQEGYDLAVGSRYINGINVVNWPISRILLSYAANFFARCITGLPVMDTTAGFHCYKRVVLETINLDAVQSMGYGFQVEMKFLAWKYGFTIRELPIVFTNRVRGHSKMSQTIIIEAFFSIIRMKVSSFFKKFHRSTSTS